MICKAYDIICNVCGHVFTAQGSKISVENEWKLDGGIIKDKKHYCDESCFGNRMKTQSNERILATREVGT